MKKTFVLSAGVALLAAGSAFADGTYVIDGVGLDLTPFDDTYDGSFGSMAFIDLVVGGEDTSLTDVDVILDIAHTWAGDLTGKLVSPSGTVITLFSRPGYAEPADDGTGCCGESSDLVFGNTYEFDDAAGTSSELMGAGGENPIASFVLHSSGGAAGPDFGLTSLNGENPNGTWRLYIGDGAGGDNGTFDGFSLQITSVPAPGALALLGVAGLVARRRRR